MVLGAGWKILSLSALMGLLVLGALVLRNSGPTRDVAALMAQETTVVIDAGHGGEDGGAVSSDGVKESDINLAVAQRLEAVLILCGRRTSMLRTGDYSLHDTGTTTIRGKKVSDLHNRVKRINEQKPARLISIHQNHFSNGKYYGAQVFYGGGPLGQGWAEMTQEAMRSGVAPGNRRQVKPVGHDIYLMNHITCPAILVECGFLSNTEECRKLTDPAYQTKIALMIGGAYLQSEAAGLFSD